MVRQRSLWLWALALAACTSDGASVADDAAVGGAQDRGVADRGVRDAQLDRAEPPVSAPEPLDRTGCEAQGLLPGRTTVVKIAHEGATREYRVYVPASVDPSKPTPLVVNWHGLGSNAMQQELYAGNAVATRRGYIVAYPNGLGLATQSFNAGVCCSQYGIPPHQANDLDFGRAVVGDVARKICIDKRRIYTTGMSNGGYMSEHNACFAADLYAAAAPVSALGILRDDCAPSRPISILTFNGTADSLVKYDVSQVNMRRWAERNGCSPEPTRKSFGDAYCDVWSDCDEGVVVQACTIPGMNHCWPGNPLIIPGMCLSGGKTAIDASEMMYDLFDRSPPHLSRTPAAGGN